jgi:hypothetical protein
MFSSRVCTLCNLITSSKSEWKTHVFFFNYKKLDTVYFNKINKISIPMVEMLLIEMQSMELEATLNVESFVTPSYTHLYNTFKSVSLIKHCP